MYKFLQRMIKPIEFSSLERNEPVSHVFGLERGMPIDRYYIENFLNMNRHRINGKVLEIAESTYSKKYSDPLQCQYEVLNYSPSKGATIIGDLTDTSTLPESSIDCFICTQTFNFIYDIKKAISGSRFLLKKDGVLIATVAGICQVSRYDMDRWGDFWRFTDKSIRQLVEDIYGEGNVDITVYGNVLAATSLLQGLAVEDLPIPNLLDKVDADYQVVIGIVAKK